MKHEQDLRELLNDLCCNLFEHLTTVNHNNARGVLGLLQAVCLFVEHGLWPANYSLEIMTMCLEVVRGPKSNYMGEGGPRQNGAQMACQAIPVNS